MHPSDAELLEQAQAGEEAAFAELVNRHRETVTRIAYRFLYDKDEAMDVAQDVFLAAYLKLATLAPHRDFAAWLYRVAINRAIERARRRSTRRRLERESGRQRPTSGRRRKPKEGGSEESARLERAMGRLSKRQRMVVALRFFEGFSVSRTAEVLGTTANNVRVTLSKALKALKKVLKK